MNDKILEVLSNLFKALNIFAPNPANTLIKEEKAQRKDIRNDRLEKKVELRNLRTERKINRLQKRINKQTK